MQGNKENNAIWSQERTRGLTEQKRHQETDPCGSVEIHAHDGGQASGEGMDFAKNRIVPGGKALKNDSLISSHTTPTHGLQGEQEVEYKRQTSKTFRRKYRRTFLSYEGGEVLHEQDTNPSKGKGEGGSTWLHKNLKCLR